ncbi:MAG: CAP domain-containing protein [Paracoccaceae bacterium]|nr:CAP domain-containing protein [Paracoccaceae bacterium]
MFRTLLAFAATLLIGAGVAEAACSVPGNAPALTAEVARLMNAERGRRGLRPLAFSEKLQRAAARQACDMASNGVRSHRGSDGSSFARRYRAAGGCGAGGENIAWGQRSPNSAIAMWMDSSGHRANILHRRARAYGIAVTVANGSPSWVMVVGGSC